MLYAALIIVPQRGLILGEAFPQFLSTPRVCIPNTGRIDKCYFITQYVLPFATQIKTVYKTKEIIR